MTAKTESGALRARLNLRENFLDVGRAGVDSGLHAVHGELAHIALYVKDVAEVFLVALAVGAKDSKQGQHSDQHHERLHAVTILTL